MAIDIERAERAVQELLASFGLEQNSLELQSTPAKVAAFWVERLDGYSFDPAAEFQPISQDFDPCPIFFERIPFTSICKHHLAPFSGYAALGYAPGNGGAVGLSKLIRLVQAFAHRLQLQEQMTWQIFNAMETHLRPKGWGVRIVAEHTCIAHRGVKMPNVPITTILMGGEWQLDPPSAFR
jgi:GTP cyclohydrolase I